MAINKVVNKSTKTHGAMRNVIEYVLKDSKVKEGYVDITGPFHGDINWDNVYRAFVEEKKLWNKDSGRMYAHNIISFHKDEQISPEECMEIGNHFCDRFFPDNQNLIAVHQDREHLHIHIVTNTVSYIDGKKLHQNKRDLEYQKKFTNNLCKEYGLSIAEKGKHFDGSDIEVGEIIGWSKDKYNLLLNESKKSFVADCAIAIMQSTENCSSRESFISQMQEKGWTVNWTDKRKHITYENNVGQKVRDTNLEKTFNLPAGKEKLIYEFKRQNEERELSKYYSEIESVGKGLNREAISDDRSSKSEDTVDFIRELRAKERAGDQKREDSVSKRLDRDYERERLENERIARERAIAEQARIRAEEEAERPKREREKSRRRDHDYSGPSL